MPANINPIKPPKSSIVERKPGDLVKQDDEPKAVPLRKLVEPVVEKPDVSHWVRKINARLSPDWLENERRCGRSFIMEGADVFAAREVAALYTGFDVSIHHEKRGLTLSFKPRRGLTMKIPNE